MGEKIVLIGGTGSGKSSRALEIARSRREFPDRVFIATATPFDDEMRGKIKKHRIERADCFKTVEEPLRLADAIAGFGRNPKCCAVVDCLTVWLCNLYEKTDGAEAQRQTEKFTEQFEKFAGLLITVTNETGMGLVAPEKNSRAYSSNLSGLNRDLVALCDRAYLLVAGMPVKIK